MANMAYNSLELIVKLELRGELLLYFLNLFDKHVVDDDLVVLLLLEVLYLLNVTIVDLLHIRIDLVHILLEELFIHSEISVSPLRMLIDLHLCSVFKAFKP